jgi:hypothetical protein
MLQAIYGTGRFITVFTAGPYPEEVDIPTPCILTSLSVLYPHTGMGLGLSTVLFPSDFRTEIVYASKRWNAIGFQNKIFILILHLLYICNMKMEKYFRQFKEFFAIIYFKTTC